MTPPDASGHIPPAIGRFVDRSRAVALPARADRGFEVAAGRFHERLDPAAGSRLSDLLPASSLFHLVLAAAVAEGAAGSADVRSA